MDNNEKFIRYNIFEPFKNLLTFTTTKQTLHTKNPRFTGDTKSIYNQNRLNLSKKLGLNPEQLVFSRQFHTDCVTDIYTIPYIELKKTDALISNQPEICLCVQTADCVPVLLFDPVKNVISAIHAGWRGTVNKILGNSIQKMVSDYGSFAKNIVAAIGPSIGPEVYEIGADVKNAVQKEFQNSETLLIKNSSGKFHFNLWEANRQILLENNVQPGNIEILGECSYQLNNKYYSARREGIETGRMVSGIILL